MAKRFQLLCLFRIQGSSSGYERNTPPPCQVFNGQTCPECWFQYVAPMVQEIVSVIDKLVALIERRERRQKAIFTDLISPIFDELLLVHKDYIAMFSEAL